MKTTDSKNVNTASPATPTTKPENEAKADRPRRKVAAADHVTFCSEALLRSNRPT